MPQGVYLKKGERIADTVEFPPHDLPMPKISSTDIDIKVAPELAYALRNLTQDSPFLNLGENA